jgi:hypothetical protein
MLDELDDEEAVRMANDSTISRILLEDAAMSPAQITTAEASITNVAAGTSQTTAALMAIRGEQPKELPAPVAPTTATNEGRRMRGVSRLPPMVGRDEGIPADPRGYPSLDDPLIIFSNGSPIRIPVSIPPVAAVPAPPAPSAPLEIPSVPQMPAMPLVPPAIISNEASAVTSISQPAPIPLPPLIESYSTAPMMSNQFSEWYNPQLSFQPLPPLPRSHNTQPFSGPIISPIPETRPAGWRNSTQHGFPSEVPPPPPPTFRAENPPIDPFGVVGSTMSQRPIGVPDFSGLFEDPNHPLNRNRQRNTADTTSTLMLWPTPIFAPPPLPQPPPIPPPIVAPVPEPPPPPSEPVIQPPPPIVSIHQQLENQHPPPVPPPAIPASGNHLAPQLIQCTTPQENPPNPLPPLLPPCPPAPSITNIPAQPPPIFNIPLPPPPITTQPQPLIIIKPPEVPVIPTIPEQPVIPPKQPEPPGFTTVHNTTTISYSDRQPHASSPPPTKQIPIITDGGDLISLFKPAYLPLLGIIAIFFYAFSTMGFAILIGVIVWYSYKFPHGVKK